MKLLQRTGRSHLQYAARTLVAAGVLLFFALTSIVNEEMTEKLVVNIDRIEARIAKGGTVNSLPPVLEVEPLDGENAAGLSVTDTIMYDPQEQDEELFREAMAVRVINGRAFRITVRQVMLEPHDYLGSIGLALAIAFGLLLLALVFIQRRIARRIWRPFYQNLDALKAFSLKEQRPLHLLDTDVDEFNDLNAVVSALVEKVQDDHRSLKEFSENAAHEMRTPLAVIQARLDEAAQDPGLSSAQAAAIGAAGSAVQRLANLNSALVLLTRIDNQQFTGRSRLVVAEVIEELLLQLSDHIAERGVGVTTELDRSITLDAEPTLFRILVTNLLKNALVHNVPDGTVHVQLATNTLRISNTGKPLNGDPARLFQRFAKAGEDRGSIGLGLSIAQRICAVHGFSITYTSSGSEHVVEVDFTLQDRSSFNS